MIFTKTPRSPGSLACPFIAGPKIIDPLLFVGRKDELRTLAARMSGVQPVSVNVVGERLIGKSSLLWYFTNTWEQLVPDPARFLVVYVCLRQEKPKNEAEFYQSLADALRKLPVVENNKPLRTALSRSLRSRKDFVIMLDLLASRTLLPVFCLDEFEKLFDHKDELNKDFYDGLHSLTGSSRMMLIIATRRRVEVCAAERQLLSAFFNFGLLLELDEFSDDEVKELLLLPSPHAPALEPEERKLAQRWGGKSPWQLELAALFLFEARRIHKPTDWAKKKFNEERDRRTQEPQQQRFLSIPPWCRVIFWDFPRWLGRWPLRLGRIVDDTANFITGWLIILLVLACLLNYAKLADLFALLLKKIG